MGEVLARKILRNLAAKNELSLAEFIAGFDIEGIGVLIAEKAVNAGFDNLEKLRSATIEELSLVDGLAEITARTIKAGLDQLGSEMDRLLAGGAVKIKEALRGGRLSGKSFCFTGELRSMKRSEAEALIKAQGGEARSAVTKGLSYLVTNDPASGSEKNKKAHAYGVAVIDEESFLDLVGQP
jgi:DNA ligase (NAD+)